MFTLVGLAGAVGTLWWALFALKPYDITPEQLAARYAHGPTQADAVRAGTAQPTRIGQTEAWAADLRLRSFDGGVATGRIVYPADPSTAGIPRPVLLALHGMGRTHWRWWQAEFKGRPTIESTHRVAERALQQGYVVVALDARGHGERKDPERPLIARELMRDLHLWGEREPYERLIVDTVKDYRVLLDWLVQQPGLEPDCIHATGYSMGAQMALLLAGVDARVCRVAAMVPPAVDDTVAVVSPRNVVGRMAAREVWLLTADEDDYAPLEANAALFAALSAPAKRHLRFDGGHLLPADYVDRLLPWLARRAPDASSGGDDADEAASRNTPRAGHARPHLRPI